MSSTLAVKNNANFSTMNQGIKDISHWLGRKSLLIGKIIIVIEDHTTKIDRMNKEIATIKMVFE